jgi:hypothetical protein
MRYSNIINLILVKSSHFILNIILHTNDKMELSILSKKNLLRVIEELPHIDVINRETIIDQIVSEYLRSTRDDPIVTNKVGDILTKYNYELSLSTIIDYYLGVVRDVISDETITEDELVDTVESLVDRYYGSGEYTIIDHWLEKDDVPLPEFVLRDGNILFDFASVFFRVLSDEDKREVINILGLDPDTPTITMIIPYLPYDLYRTEILLVKKREHNDVLYGDLLVLTAQLDKVNYLIRLIIDGTLSDRKVIRAIFDYGTSKDIIQLLMNHSFSKFHSSLYIIFRREPQLIEDVFDHIDKFPNFELSDSIFTQMTRYKKFNKDVLVKMLNHPSVDVNSVASKIMDFPEGPLSLEILSIIIDDVNVNILSNMSRVKSNRR